MVAKGKHDQFGRSWERHAALEELELSLAEMEEDALQAEAAAQIAANAAATANIKVAGSSGLSRRGGHYPECLPRKRIVYPSPSPRPCCRSVLHKLAQDITERIGRFRGNGR